MLIVNFMLRKLSTLTLLLAVVLFLNCTKLNETFEGGLTPDQVGPSSSDALLRGVYNSLHGPFTDHLTIFPLLELTTDAAIAPTRGPDWDDNGTWRALHQHQWNPGNIHITECFNALNGTVFSATDLLRFNPTPQQEAEARFLRALAMYYILDLFDQVPYREPGESVIQPARVKKGMEAWDSIIEELKAVEHTLPPDAPAYKANKFAAKFLLMKCYLNKGVYKNRPESPSFEPADMSEVIRLADEIINSGNYEISGDYFGNFAPDNENSNENLFTLLNDAGSTPDNYLFLTSVIVLHYNQVGCCNGFSTLSDFYDKFEANDKRRGTVYRISGFPPNPRNSINLGFLVGQQYDLFSGDSLKDRFGAPLNYTRKVHNIETGTDLEVTGIRPLKYFPDYPHFGSPGNDFVFFRYPDVLLMKAEALLRASQANVNDALAIVNSIRTHPSRGASGLNSLTLADILEERARELWWEGWRRQDLIRFGRFLERFQEKEYESDKKYLLFPIPNDQLAFNRYLEQNPGY